MLSRIRHFIDEHQLLSQDELHLVALSGGADSVALLLILQQLGYRLEAVHCNFHLRGEESDRDERFVCELCEKKNIPVHLIHFDTEEYAKLHQVSIEMAARELRYRYFEQLRTDIGASTVCVAHHRDDSVETVILNLARGTGLDGLCGIRPRNGRIVRPLLCVSRSEIEQFLGSIGQPYVTDSTNLKADVLRNKVRLNVLPLLRDLNPSVDQHIADAALRMQEVRKIYDSSVENQLDSIFKDGAVNISDLLSSPSPKALLYELMSRYGFSTTQVNEVFKSLMDRTGIIWNSNDYDLLIDRGRLCIESHQEQMKEVKIPECGTYVFADEKRIHVSCVDGHTVSRNPDMATLDADKVEFPLLLRTVQQGDSFVPFGMSGRRLLSDYLTDLHLSRFERRKQLVVLDASGRIVWVAGKRIDNRFCVTPTTKRVLKISFS